MKAFYLAVYVCMHVCMHVCVYFPTWSRNLTQYYTILATNIVVMNYNSVCYTFSFNISLIFFKVFRYYLAWQFECFFFVFFFFFCFCYSQYYIFVQVIIFMKCVPLMTMMMMMLVWLLFRCFLCLLG